MQPSRTNAPGFVEPAYGSAREAAALERFLYDQQVMWHKHLPKVSPGTPPTYLYGDTLTRWLRASPQDGSAEVDVDWLAYTPRGMQGCRAAIGFRITKAQFPGTTKAGFAGHYMVELLHEQGLNSKISQDAFFDADRIGRAARQPDERGNFGEIAKHLRIVFTKGAMAYGRPKSLPWLKCTNPELAFHLKQQKMQKMNL